MKTGDGRDRATKTENIDNVNFFLTNDEGTGVPEKETRNTIKTFLSSVWDYPPDIVGCFSLIAISDKGGIEYRHFAVEDREIEEIVDEATEHVLENIRRWERQGYGVFFQVLPLNSVPEKGRGTASDVEVAQWLFADLDYKEDLAKKVQEEAEEWLKGELEERCEEGEDHSLECVYQERGKWYAVKRPPLGRVLEVLKQRIGIPTIVVDSGAGYHVYYKLSRPVAAYEAKEMLDYLVKVLNADKQSKDLARALRLPGTLNHRVGRRAAVIFRSDKVYEPKEMLYKLLDLAAQRKSFKLPGTAKKLRELSDEDIVAIAEHLRKVYIRGYRQSVVLFLSGALAKAGISPITAIKIIQYLREVTEDEDDEKTRYSALVYSYKKNGISLEEYASQMEEMIGEKPYGLDREIDPGTVKGYSGLEEIFREVLSEEIGQREAEIQTMRIMNEISRIMNKDVNLSNRIAAVLDLANQKYVVADFRDKIIVLADLRDGEFRYGRILARAVPIRITIYESPVGVSESKKLEIVFDRQVGKPLLIGPGSLDEVAARLCADGYVIRRRDFVDMLSAIILSAEQQGLVEWKTGLDVPGFYLDENGKIGVTKYDIREPTAEKLRQALMMLNELGTNWYSHAVDKFATVVRWTAVSPFAFVLKSKGEILRWLFLYGDSATGKTTLGKIALRIWGLGTAYEKTGGSIDTPARLGYVLSFSTFPTLVNEPWGALVKEEIVEIMKNAVDGLVARGRFTKGNSIYNYSDILALSPLILTSNKILPRYWDDALKRRFYMIGFSYGEKIPLSKQVVFKKKVEPKLSLLSEIGNFIAYYVMKHPELLDKSVDELSETLLRACYEYAGMKMPEWLKKEYQEEEEDTIMVEFLERFKKHVNDLFTKHVGKAVIELENGRLEIKKPYEVDFANKILTLIKHGHLKGVNYTSTGKLHIKRQLLEELKLDISLRSLAELFKWEYRKTSIRDSQKGGKVVAYYAAILRLEDLLKYYDTYGNMLEVVEGEEEEEKAHVNVEDVSESVSTEKEEKKDEESMKRKDRGGEGRSDDSWAKRYLFAFYSEKKNGWIYRCVKEVAEGLSCDQEFETYEGFLMHLMNAHRVFPEGKG
ncbi:MAG: hypothetical protein RMJ06_06600 [Nitrososphaerota archaeon]|nr:hypothetical protein [Nitrososphaerota archaeon]